MQDTSLESTASYVGRFAPSPTGPLHLGSLFSALASWLDARANHGRWLLRIEDLDTPRVVPGAEDDIKRQLLAFGLEWDGNPCRQSERSGLYRDALCKLDRNHLLFACSCSRREARKGPGQVYPGTCRDRGLPVCIDSDADTALRVRVNDSPVTVRDRIQPTLTQRLARDVGDFIVRRRDGLIAYQLAVVVDDADQGITDIVRGVDIFDSTPRQKLLQDALALNHPRYAHTPLLLGGDNRKLSKQNHARAVDTAQANMTLVRLMHWLGQSPPTDLQHGDVSHTLDWAVRNWSLKSVPRSDIRIKETSKITV